MSDVPNTKCIAISRQQGSGGSFIGRAVAERLGFRYFDREMLRAVAEYLKEHEHAHLLEWPILGNGADDNAAKVGVAG